MLVENKATLRELRNKQRSLGKDVNATKTEIDELKLMAEQKREVRRSPHVKYLGILEIDMQSRSAGVEVPGYWICEYLDPIG